MMLSKISKFQLDWFDRILSNRTKALTFGAWGAAGGAVGAILGEMLRLDTNKSFILLSMLEVGCWFGIIGACISIALLVGDTHYFKQGLQIKQAIQRVAWFGLLAGFGAGAIAQGTYRLMGPTEVLRVICWGIAGGLLGFGIGARIPNLGRLRGTIGGVVGGLIGSCLFIFFTTLIDVSAGRLLGTTAIGFFIGIMIVILESVMRKAWLIVRWSDNEAIEIPIGLEPIVLGSSREARIYLDKKDFPPITAKVYLENKKVVMQFDEAMQQQKSMKILRHELSHGDKRKLGKITIEVQTST
jgi:predicted membrane protein